VRRAARRWGSMDYESSCARMDRRLGASGTDFGVRAWAPARCRLLLFAAEALLAKFGDGRIRAERERQPLVARRAGRQGPANRRYRAGGAALRAGVSVRPGGWRGGGRVPGWYPGLISFKPPA